MRTVMNGDDEKDENKDENKMSMIMRRRRRKRWGWWSPGPCLPQATHQGCQCWCCQSCWCHSCSGCCCSNHPSHSEDIIVVKDEVKSFKPFPRRSWACARMWGLEIGPSSLSALFSPSSLLCFVLFWLKNFDRRKSWFEKSWSSHPGWHNLWGYRWT